MDSKLYYCCNDVLEDTPGGKVIVSIYWLEQRECKLASCIRRRAKTSDWDSYMGWYL